MQRRFDRNEAIGMLLTPENLMPPQVGATYAFQKHPGGQEERDDEATFVAESEGAWRVMGRSS
ncbi:hypothetical protein ACP6EK_06020 [Candidatus Caldatribacterium sp. SIUC1]|uniref:hypothetical protein n=1 Tax=Candidatus Caldatribacterium sp. SIUC1 TaxID=3418365 RepID=UPI003F691A89